MISSAVAGRGTDEAGGVRPRLALRIMLVFLLTAAVLLEGYYIFVLRDKIEKQTEELRNISIRLQNSKDESADLRDELTSIKKITGETKNGNTADRQD